MTKALSRTSALAARHAALGSGLEDWNGMGTAWTYDSDPNAEHDAVREAAGMFDMSPLKKVFVRGPSAETVLDHLVTRNLRGLGPGKSVYTSVLTDEGTMADDAIVGNNGGGEWMIVHGSGQTMELLRESAEGREVDVGLDDDLHDVSVQGPRALAVLDSHCSIDLAGLAYFDHCAAALFGHECRISRTGYSGERGYEIFARAGVVVDVWDRLADAGIVPCSFTALDKVRIEAGLLFYGYDMSAEHTPFEVGLGFTVSPGKSGYRGHEALAASRGGEKIRNVCLVIDHEDMVNGGEAISLGERTVGVVNSPCYSHRMKKSLALGHVAPDVPDGARVAVSGDGVDAAAEIVATPIYDPTKSRTHG